MAVVNGKTELDNIIPEIWSTKWYPILRANTPLTNFVARDYEGELKFGDTIYVHQVEDATGEILTDDKASFNSEIMTINRIPIIVNQRFSAAFEFTDMAQLQSQTFENEARSALVNGIALQMENYITGLLLPSTSSPDHDIAPAAASDLVAADVAGIRTLLSIQNVPEAERALFLAPSYYGDLMTKTTISSSDYIPAGSPTSTGTMPFPIFGFNVTEARNLGNDIGYAIHKSAVQMIIQQGLRIKISDLHSSHKYGFVLSADLVGQGKLMDDVRLVKISA